MKQEQFSEKAPGQIVPTEQGDGVAFVPDPLPPTFAIDYKLANAISEADVALAQLNGLARTLPDPELLARSFIRVEAVDSSRIEGTQTTYSDLALFEAAQQAVEPDTVVVANYLKALNHGLKMLDTVPVSRRLFCEVHAVLMRGYQEQRSRPGEIRKGQVVIGPLNAPPKQARFVPPPRTYLDDLIADLERFCNNYRELPLLLRVAMIHYQFETIHPFWDGNGRVGRLLILLLLTAEKRLFRPILYLSRFSNNSERLIMTCSLQSAPKVRGSNGFIFSWKACDRKQPTPKFEFIASRSCASVTLTCSNHESGGRFPTFGCFIDSSKLPSLQFRWCAISRSSRVLPPKIASSG